LKLGLCGTHFFWFRFDEFLKFFEYFLVFNLTNKLDVEETERKIAEYKDANKEAISKNRGKLVSEFDLSLRSEMNNIVFIMNRVMMKYLLNI